MTLNKNEEEILYKIQNDDKEDKIGIIDLYKKKTNGIDYMELVDGPLKIEKVIDYNSIKKLESYNSKRDPLYLKVIRWIAYKVNEIHQLLENNFKMKKENIMKNKYKIVFEHKTSLHGLLDFIERKTDSLPCEILDENDDSYFDTVSPIINPKPKCRIKGHQNGCNCKSIEVSCKTNSLDPFLEKFILGREKKLSIDQIRKNEEEEKNKNMSLAQAIEKLLSKDNLEDRDKELLKCLLEKAGDDVVV